MRRAQLALVLSVGGLSFLASSSASASDCTHVSSDNLIACARELDPLHESLARATVPGGYRTAFGLQIHPSCFKIAENSLNPLSRSQSEKNVDLWVQDAFLSVLGNCQVKYPELRPYLNEWVTQARRTVITCVNKTQEEIGAGAINEVSIEHARKNVLYKEALEGIELKTDPVLEREKKVTLASLREPLIIFPSDGISYCLRGLNSYCASTIVHEVFHSTHANNRNDHDSIEKTIFTLKNACSESIVDDRINIVADLCTGSPVGNGLADSAELLSSRISQCGRKKGCENLFTSVSTQFTAYIPTRPLPEAAAARLCDRLQDDGFCTHTLKDPKQRVALMSLMRKQSPVFEKVEQRLGEILPRSANEIPSELLKAYPALKSDLLSFKSTDCFDFLFYPTRSGDLVLRADQPQWMVDDIEERLRFALSYSSHTGWNQRAFLRFKEKDVRCSNTNTATQIQNTLFKLERNLAEVVQSVSFSVFAKPLLLKISDELAPAVAFTRLGNLNDPAETEFRQLLGPALYDEFAAALLKFHPDSPRFDCQAAGLSLHRTAESAVGTLQEILSPQHAPACRL